MVKDGVFPEGVSTRRSFGAMESERNQGAGLRRKNVLVRGKGCMNLQYTALEEEPGRERAVRA